LIGNKNMTENLLKFYLALACIFVPKTFPSQYDYIYPNQGHSFGNYGGVGLLQNPTARLHPAGTIGFNWVDNDPYQRGSIIAYPFDWFEASYQYTDVNNAFYSNVPAFSGSQTYKDKSFDAKIALIKESALIPAMALGARDLGGTGIFSSEYFVLSKKVKNIDFTVGMGWGTLAGGADITNPFSYISNSFEERTGAAADSQGGDFNTGSFFSGTAALFAGAEIYLPNFKGSRIKVEYDGTDYDDEGFPNGRDDFDLAFKGIEKASSQFNIGIVYPLLDNLHLKLSWVKGNNLSFGFSFSADFSKENPKVKKNDPHTEVPLSSVVKKINTERSDLIYLSALKYLNERQLFLQKASVTSDEIEVLYTQSKFISYPQATGRVAKVLDEISPERIKRFKISNFNAGTVMNTIEIDRHSFRLYEQKSYTAPLEKSSTISRGNDSTKYMFNPKVKRPSIFWHIAPSLQSQIGGPDGFYFGNLALSFHTEIILTSNLTFQASANAGILNNYEDLKLLSDSVLPHVRTDQVLYAKESSNFNIPRFQFNYFHRLGKDTYSKISAGIFEAMFGGIGGEVLYRPFKKNYAVGVELWDVTQRAYDQKFSFNDYQTETGHLTLYYEEPRTNILLKIKGGKFLAGDSGFNFDFSRRFKSGTRIGAFFSLSDISKYEFGEGSFDKGFYFFIPIQYFFSNYSKPLTGFGLRPIQRDGAQSLIHSRHLYGVTDQASEYNIFRTWDNFYD
jgi:hypothetical protein